MNVGIIGFGEVGSAIKRLMESQYTVTTRDINFDELKSPIDYLHICIPYNQKFEDIVVKAIEELQPRLTIIHSTVKPGTTKQIYKKSKAPIVHSPFMGVHPIKPNGQFIHGQGHDLFDYFKRFPKMIGPVTSESAQVAQDHFESVGLETKTFDTSDETEMGKILSTTYYGWNIIFEKWVHSICQQNELNFDQVYTQYNTIYNNGYKQTLPGVVRPVLKHHQGEIGGHCVIPNASIIQDWLQDEFTRFLLEQNKKLGESNKKSK